MKWAQALHWLGLAWKVSLGLVLIRSWMRTRFWVPRYVHWMAAAALLIGLGMLVIMPSDAPVNREGWPTLNRALVVLFFPAVVYLAFVVYGGQRAAYEARTDRIPCPHCRGSQGIRGETCPACGQTIA